ncbi:hypothetical protein KZ117_002798 [Enterococcus faecalis]|nr:hypothetical protein [Enterococcus faecalis]
MIDSKEDNINEDEYEKEIRKESKRLANEVFLDLKKYEDIRLSNGNKHVFCMDYILDRYQDLSDISFDNNFNNFCNNLLEEFQNNNYVIKDFHIDYVEEKGFFKKYRIAKLRIIYA